MYVATLAHVERGNPCIVFTRVNFELLSYDSLHYGFHLCKRDSVDDTCCGQAIFNFIEFHS